MASQQEPESSPRTSSPGQRAEQDRWVSGVGHGAFLAIFPGFFAYHTMANRGFIPGVLGGYSTAIALLVLPVLLPAYLRRIGCSGGAMPGLDRTFFAFVAYFVAVTVGHLIAGTNAEIAIPYVGVAAQFVSIYLMVRLLDLGSVAFRWSTVASLAAVTGLAFWNAIDEDFLRGLDFTASDTRVADYQAYAFVYLVLVVFAAAALRARTARLLVYLAAIPTLLVNGARSEFGAVLLVIAVVEYCHAKRRRALAVMILAVGIGLYASAELLENLIPDSRVLALARAAEDESAIERGRMLHEAWRTVGESPILGRFASYPPGEYAHNALSAWVDLGLAGFVFFVALLLGPLALLLRRFGEDSRRPGYVLALVCAVTLVVLSAGAKNFTYQLFPVAMALFANWSCGAYGSQQDTATSGDACSSEPIT